MRARTRQLPARGHPRQPGSANGGRRLACAGRQGAAEGPAAPALSISISLLCARAPRRPVLTRHVGCAPFAAEIHGPPAQMGHARAASVCAWLGKSYPLSPTLPLEPRKGIGRKAHTQGRLRGPGRPVAGPAPGRSRQLPFARRPLLAAPLLLLQARRPPTGQPRTQALADPRAARAGLAVRRNRTECPACIARLPWIADCSVRSTRRAQIAARRVCALHTTRY